MVPIVKQSGHCWIRLYAAETQHWRFCHLVSWETQQPGYVNSVKACWLTTVKKAMNLLELIALTNELETKLSLLQYASIVRPGQKRTASVAMNNDNSDQSISQSHLNLEPSHSNTDPRHLKPGHKHPDSLLGPDNDVYKEESQEGLCRKYWLV